jgi:hypothetical protein
MIIDVPQYDDTSERNGRLYKSLHCSWTKEDEVVSQVSGTEFQVLTPSLYGVGQEIRFRDADYVNFSDATVLSIDGDVITINTDQSFYTAGDLIDFIGFADGGNYYAFF